MDLKTKPSNTSDLADADRTGNRNGSWRRPFSVRLSDPEFRIVELAAEKNHDTISAFLRRSALREAGAPVPPKQRNRDLLARTIAENVGILGRVSSSANQIARNGNMGLLRAGEAVAALKHLNTQLAEIRKALVDLDGDDLE